MRGEVASPAQLRTLRTAGDGAFRLVVDLMSGCGLRHGEAYAVNIDNVVADDVHRVTEQVNRTTKHYAPLKHRAAGDYRDVPLPARTRQSIAWYADTYGTVDGYLPCHPQDITRPFQHYSINNQACAQARQLLAPQRSAVDALALLLARELSGAPSRARHRGAGRRLGHPLTTPRPASRSGR
ncbi:hypothetical protein ABZ641_21310, partial [Kitasatospora sp. NPDC007106]